jgi:PAS domain S-box-containing protein
MTARVLERTTAAGGLVCLAAGATVMVAWMLRATAVLRFASLTPMRFNTALALTVTGAALVVPVGQRWPRAPLVAGIADACIGLAVLAEYALGHGLGIDQFFVHDYLSRPPEIPGRVAVNTAVCLTLAGAGLLAWAPWRSRPRPIAIAIAGSFIAAIALLATFGYASGAHRAYGWGRLTGMALTTAVALIVLAVALLSAAWRAAIPDSGGGVPRWVPIPAGVAALGLAVAVWLTVIHTSGGASRLDTSVATGAATALGLLMAAMVALVVALAQRANARSRLAQAETARRAQAEEQARASENRTFQFLSAMPVAVFVTTQGGEPYYANKDAQRILGKGVVPGIAGDDIAQTYQAFVAGTDRLYDALPVLRALQGEATHVDDMEIRHPDGTVIPVEVWGSPVYGDDGRIDYGIVAFADATERKAKERTIAAQAALLDMAHDAVLVRDIDARITFWNTGAEHTYGYPRSEATGRISHELLQTQFTEPLADIEAAVVRDDRWDGELNHRRADGHVITVESRWAAQRLPDGTLTGFLEVNRDITAKKAAERELLQKSAQVQALNQTLERQVQQRTQHLEQANRNLEAFAYSVAHDLRTPLRAMSGFAEALVEDYSDGLGDTGREYAERIQAASQRMAALIDDLLHLSRVSRTEITPEPVDLSTEAAAICDRLRAVDPARHVSVTIQPGVVVRADHDLIRTALESLLHNAWKFTSERADACVEFGTVAAGLGEVCCFVRDNGTGFDPAYVHKLFQPFQRLHAATEFPGSGVGLASVRQIIERHGGQVRAEGTIGGGATFYFTLGAQGNEA